MKTKGSAYNLPPEVRAELNVLRARLAASGVYDPQVDDKIASRMHELIRPFLAEINGMDRSRAIHLEKLQEARVAYEGHIRVALDAAGRLAPHRRDEYAGVSLTRVLRGRLSIRSVSIMLGRDGYWLGSTIGNLNIQRKWWDDAVFNRVVRAVRNYDRETGR